MDPLSVTTNAFALLSAAAVTCKAIIDLASKVLRASSDVRADLASLVALQNTLQRLDSTWRVLPSSIGVSSALPQHLEKFLLETQDLEESMARLDSFLGPGSDMGRRAVATLKWLAAGEKRLKAFLDRAQFWNGILSTELQIIQICMMQQITVQQSCQEGLIRQAVQQAVLVAPPRQAPLVELRLCSEPYNPQPPKDQVWLSDRFSDPIGIQPITFRRLHSPACSLQLVHGLVVMRKPGRGSVRRDFYEVCLQSHGHEITITFSCAWIRSFKLVMRIYAYQKHHSLPGWWNSFNIRVRSVVPGDWPSFKAAKLGDLELMKQLLDSKRASLNDTTSKGESLLHAAVRGHSHAVVSMLLRAGIDVDVSDDNNVTPLHLAVRTGANMNIIKLLLDSGADISRQDRGKLTPLHHFFDSRTQELLLRADTDVPIYSMDSRGLTPAHYVAWSSQSTVKDVTNVLSRTHMPLLEPDSNGRTLMHYAAERGNLALIRHLLTAALQHGGEQRGEPIPENRSSINTCSDNNNTGLNLLLRPDKKGRTPLFFATDSSRAPEAIELLAQFHSGLAAKDKRGRSLLHQAAARGRVLAIQKLADMGAAGALELRRTDEDGFTPLQLALERKAPAAAINLLTALSRDADVSTAPHSPNTAEEGQGRISTDIWWRRVRVLGTGYPWARLVPAAYITYMVTSACFHCDIPLALVAVVCGVALMQRLASFVFKISSSHNC